MHVMSGEQHDFCVGFHLVAVIKNVFGCCTTLIRNNDHKSVRAEPIPMSSLGNTSCDDDDDDSAGVRCFVSCPSMLRILKR